MGMLPHWQNDRRITEVVLVLPGVVSEEQIPAAIRELSKIRLGIGNGDVDPRRGARNMMRFQQWVVPQVIRRTRPDVFLSTFHLCPFFTGGVPVVTTIHDLCPLYQPVTSPGSLKWREMHRFQLRTACLKSTLLIAVSKFTAGILRAYAPSTHSRIRVVHNGFTPPEIGAAPPLHGDYLLWVGELGYRKNPELGFATLALLRKEHPALRLVAVVPQRDRDAALASARSIGIADAIDFHSAIEDADLDALYRSARALLVPSRCEGFGYPLLEAMSRGVPAVGHRRSPAIEIVGHCHPLPEDLTPVSFASVVDTLLRMEPATKTELSLALRERALQFSTEQMARETADVLLEATRPIHHTNTPS